MWTDTNPVPRDLGLIQWGLYSGSWWRWEQERDCEGVSEEGASSHTASGSGCVSTRDELNSRPRGSGSDLDVMFAS